MPLVKLLSKSHWNLVIYQLLYPGFLGSMIYELVDVWKGTDKNFILTDYLTQLLITLFYCLDYFHLYGDIEEKLLAANKQKQKGKWYLICDLVSCILFFLAFFFVKLKWYEASISCIATIPFCFWKYKRKIVPERKFHQFYAIGGACICTIFILSKMSILPLVDIPVAWPAYISLPARIVYYYPSLSLTILVTISFGVYLYYVLHFYEKHGAHAPADDYL